MYHTRHTFPYSEEITIEYLTRETTQGKDWGTGKGRRRNGDG